MSTKPFIPTEPGHYALACGESDDQWEYIAVFFQERAKGTFLVCECDAGTYPVQMTHDGLTNPRWRPVPMKGMTVQPYGYPSEKWEILVGGMFAGLCRFLIGQPEAVAAFKRDTGKDLESLVTASPIARMVDDATGRTASLMAAWMDWVAANHWGEAAASVDGSA